MADFFNIKPQVLKTPEQAYSEILGNSSENQIVEIDVNLIDEIDDQPQKIHEDKILRIAESMKIVGQLDPIIVIPNTNKGKGNRFILIAGRHRRRACIMNGQSTVKAMIRKEKDKDKQRLMLLATNNDRNMDYAPSELAFSYLEQMQLLQKLGSRSTASKIAEENNTNRKTVHKYIQLTKLIHPLLSRVDNGSMTVGAGYELSFLTSEQQRKIFNFLLNHPDCHITKENARLIREDPEAIEHIFYQKEAEPVEENVNVTEAPKAEKKIKSSNSQQANCPSEGQTKITEETLTVIGWIIFRENPSVYRFLINQCPTADEFISYINENFVKVRMMCSKPNKAVTFQKIHIGSYSMEFEKKLRVHTLVNHVWKDYSLPYKEVDTAVRMFLRKHISVEEKMNMLKKK